MHLQGTNFPGESGGLFIVIEGGEVDHWFRDL